MIFNSGVVNLTKHVITRVVGGLLAVLWFVTASDSAVASCGDYLEKQAHPAGAAQVTGLERIDFVLMPGKPVSLPRCSGPGCSPTPQSPSQPHLADFQRITFRDLNVPGSSGVTTDALAAYLEHTSKVSPKSPDRDRLKRPPDLSWKLC